MCGQPNFPKLAMAKQISSDAENNLKRQARRRLIGAVALVLAVVVFLPMVFDSEPATDVANNIELRIPDKDKVPALASPVEVAPAPAVAASAVSIAPVEIAEPASAVVVSPAPLMDKLEAAKPEVTKTESKPKPQAAPKVVAKPTVAAPVKAPAKTGFVVQVGAYSNADTAKQMNAKLSKAGFHVYTEKAGNMVRVRVGSYPTREAADKIKLKLEKLGLHPNVVNLE
jgi:DedD protein